MYACSARRFYDLGVTEVARRGAPRCAVAEQQKQCDVNEQHVMTIMM